MNRIRRKLAQWCLSMALKLQPELTDVYSDRYKYVAIEDTLIRMAKKKTEEDDV